MENATMNDTMTTIISAGISETTEWLLWTANMTGPENMTQTTVPAQIVDEADDAIWILTSTFIIFTMQSGFGLLESGSVTPKNEVNIMVKNAVDVVIGGLSYWMFGYGLSFGDHRFSNPFCGWGDFFVNSENDDLGSLYSKFFFQASFATTATTIVSGAMAERTKLEAYIVFSFLNTVVYCMPAHWVWADNGFLFRLGIVDIAGAGPVHLVGGVTGLVSTLMLKPRYGRYKSVHAPPMGSPTNALLGMFMLWWGWLGFNCGSTFGISGFKWKLAARSAASTMMSSIGGGMVGLGLRSAVTSFMASVGGGVVAIVISFFLKKRKFDVAFIINGVLGALVGITALCALAQPWEGLVIGSVGACLALGTIELLDKLKIDDPVGVVGVHAVGGIWSLLSVGLFAQSDQLRHALGIQHNNKGLFYEGSGYLLGCQVIGILVMASWTAVVSYILLKVIDMTIGLRVDLQQEILGADLVEHAIGDIQYDKATNRVVHIDRRRVQGDNTEGLEYNQARKRRMSRVSEDLIRKASLMIQGQKGQNLRAPNDKMSKVNGLGVNGHGINGHGGNRQDNSNGADQSHTETGRVVQSETSDNEVLKQIQYHIVSQHRNQEAAEGSKHANTLWKFAVGKTMNKDAKKRRNKAKESMSFVLSKRRMLRQNSVSKHVEENHAKDGANTPSTVDSGRWAYTGEMSQMSPSPLRYLGAGGHVNSGASLEEEEYVAYVVDMQGKTKVTDSSGSSISSRGFPSLNYYDRPMRQRKELNLQVNVGPTRSESEATMDSYSQYV